MKLIDNARNWWRFWSNRLTLAAMAVFAYYIENYEFINAAWQQDMPTYLSFLSPEVVKYIGFALGFGSIVARQIRQSKLHKDGSNE